MGRFTSIRIAFKSPVNAYLALVDSEENLIKLFFNGIVDRDLNVEWNRLDDNGVLFQVGLIMLC